MTKKKKDEITQTKDWPYYGASKDICRILGKISGREGYNPLEIFRFFLQICHASLDRLPSLFRQAVQAAQCQVEPYVREAIFQNPPELAEAWQAITGKFKHSQTMQTFAEAFQVLLEATNLPDGRPSYADAIGNVYMEFLPGGKWRPHAQFFTPWNVANMMAAMSLGTYPGIEAMFRQQFEQAVQSDPGLSAMCNILGLLSPIENTEGDELARGISSFMHLRFWPAIAQRIEPLTVCDPCCGSGVMLLAAANNCPRWLIDIGWVQFYGVDIDPLCVDMARLNMRLYGIEPVLKAADSLTLAEIAAQPWPYDRLYEGVVEARRKEDSAAEALFQRGIELARSQQLELWPGLPGIMEPAPAAPPARKKRQAIAHPASLGLFPESDS